MATFYLKYRPQTISDLDLDSVRVQLTNVLKTKQTPHAFLFSGPRGLGKTSAARIIAKSINCVNRKGIEPCNECESCKSITSGNAVDVIEIDGASNRGIDDVRALRESIHLAPLRLKKKIYVIDEVHMLTKEAFNALLKTLEEPPEHVIFILATTEPHKVPETIISRAFHIQFQRALKIELTRSLQRVIEGEGLSVDKKILEKIIEKSNGGFRDSAKMLEQLSFVSKNITEEVFESIFPQSDVLSFLSLLSKRKGKEALEWLRVSEEIGVDWEETIRTILSTLEAELLNLYGIGTSNNIMTNEEEIREMIKIIMRASYQLKYSFSPVLPLEIAVSEWCGEKKNPNNDGGENEEESKSFKNINTNEALEKDVKKAESQGIDSSKKEKKTDHGNEKIIEVSKGTLPFKIAELTEKWGEILQIVKMDNFSVEALLRSAKPCEISGYNVVIKVYYEFHKGRLETDKCLKIVEEAFDKVFKAKPKICYILGEKEEKKIVEEKADQQLVRNVEEVFS
jgi:DNA polymerase-3 subunit gamma/tau